MIYKSVNKLYIEVNSGFHSHDFQYMQNAHTNSVNIRNIEESHCNLWKIEFILNIANASLFQYVCATLCA